MMNNYSTLQSKDNLFEYDQFKDIEFNNELFKIFKNKFHCQKELLRNKLVDWQKYGSIIKALPLIAQDNFIKIIDPLIYSEKTISDNDFDKYYESILNILRNKSKDYILYKKGPYGKEYTRPPKKVINKSDFVYIDPDEITEKWIFSLLNKDILDEKLLNF